MWKAKFLNGTKLRVLFNVAIALGIIVCLSARASVSSVNNMLIFNPSVKQGTSLFIIHNIAPIKILIGHPVAHPSASAGWDSGIDSNHWSAFMLARPNFKISCQNLTQFNRYQYVNCGAILKVYYFPKVFIGNPRLRNSTFWVAENQTLPKLLKQIRARKIKVPQIIHRPFRAR